MWIPVCVAIGFDAVLHPNSLIVSLIVGVIGLVGVRLAVLASSDVKIGLGRDLEKESLRRKYQDCLSRTRRDRKCSNSLTPQGLDDWNIACSRGLSLWNGGLHRFWYQQKTLGQITGLGR